MDLAPYIKELITQNECIILPNFGGFETAYLPAKFNPKSKQMLPPSKSIVFKPEFTVGGELLEQLLENKLKIENTNAKSLVVEYVSDIRKHIQSTREFNINGVGFFSVKSDGKLIFHPYEEENYLVDSFGLEPLKFEETEFVESRFEETRDQLKKKVFKIRPRSNSFAFVAFGIALIAVLLTITVFISARFDLYLFNIGDHSENNELIIFGGDYNKDSVNVIIDNQIDENTLIKNALRFTEIKNTPESQQSNSYILVAGSFDGLNNAQELKDKLLEDGFKVEIVETGGYYRVSVGSYSNKEEALNELKRIRTQINGSVWLLTIPAL